jgi:IPTL-CTERM motif
MFRNFFAGLLLSLIAISANAGAGATLSSLTFTKSFGSATVPLNGTTSLTLTMKAGPNIGDGYVGDFKFSDVLPAGLVVATPSGLSALAPANCLGAQPGVGYTAVAGSSQIDVNVARITSLITCSFSVNVKGTTPGLKSNTVTAESNDGVSDFADVGNSSLTATADLMVIAAPAAPRLIPTLSQWGLILSAALLGLSAFWAFKRRVKPKPHRDV